MNKRTAPVAEDVIGDRSTPQQREQRLVDITNWLQYFQEDCQREFGGTVVYAENAARDINHVYWETLEECVRPRITSQSGKEVTVDRHKICSLTELIIAHQSPVEHDDAAKKIDLSARLAYYCALNILGCWDSRIATELHVSDSFEREHLTWLRNLQRCSENFPIFSNAATWYLVERLFIERSERSVA
ncbi:hypothetical protein [Azonexus sp.]|uniref:hypothetical protein n=1 Tax=Azonexus sp. TaxID=1872668 RepID=UPI0027B96484|nr:hypothetical protein [Azonexus sp.]